MFYKIDVYASKNYNDDLFLILEATKEYDMIHFFWRKLLLQFDTIEFDKKLEEHSYNKSTYFENIKNKLSTGIYDHLFIDDENIKLFQNIYTKYCKSYYTCSKKLEKIYQDIKEYPNPWGTIHDTFDEKLYDGGDKTRYLKRNREELVIGWVGNSNWNIKYKDYKGFHSVLTPVLDELIEEGYKIKKFFADRNVSLRSNEEMPSYYQELDICIITSIEEGTPRPLIEAMASGVPIITTDVGIATEVLGPKQLKYLLGKRTGENDSEIRKQLKEKIINLYNHREILKDLSKENYEYSKKNSISNLKKSYQKYFDDFLKAD